MHEPSLERYLIQAVDRGATHARLIDPASVVTAAWVRLKCQFGCSNYNRRYGCPPDTPTPESTRTIIDSYNRAILFHKEAAVSPDRWNGLCTYFDMLIDMEVTMFKDGLYRAFLFLAGPCHLCKDCNKIAGLECNNKLRARPSMEACGIDVYQTARNNGFYIEPLRERTDTRNIYCLMLVD